MVAAELPAPQLQGDRGFSQGQCPGASGRIPAVEPVVPGHGSFRRELVAVDGSKFRAQNSKNNNYNAAKVERHMKYIDKKLEEYFGRVDKLDEEEQAKSRQKHGKRSAGEWRSCWRGAVK